MFAAATEGETAGPVSASGGAALALGAAIDAAVTAVELALAGPLEVGDGDGADVSLQAANASRTRSAAGFFMGRGWYPDPMATTKAKPEADPRTAAELVDGYVKESAPLERRGEGGPEQLPSGAAILALDAAGRTRAVVAAFRAIPRAHDGAYGKRIMLGLLATTLLRAKLPLEARDLVAMALAAAHGISPAYGPCDYDKALVAWIAKHGGAPSDELAAALPQLAARRGAKFAEDRKVGQIVDEILRRR